VNVNEIKPSNVFDEETKGLVAQFSEIVTPIKI
jgi:hypothetical protein